MTAEIICVGTELLLGDIVNTNAQFLSRELAELGISVLHQHVIGDNPGRLRDLVKEAKSRRDVYKRQGLQPWPGCGWPAQHFPAQRRGTLRGQPHRPCCRSR